MDLWIRSQDRSLIIKCNSVGLDETSIQVNFEDGIGFVIGEYSTKERTLEVLDEINERIMIMNIFKFIGIQNEKSAMALRKVFNEEKLKGIAYPYEMPKE